MLVRKRKLPSPYEVAYKNAFTPEQAAKIFGGDVEKYREYYAECDKKLEESLTQLVAIFSANSNDNVHNADS